MPYAKENMVSQDFIEGGIEITDTEYDDAITAMTRGQNIAIRNGKMKVLSLETKIVYDVVNGTPLEIPENDDVPDGYTVIPQPSKNHVWDGTQWVVDINLLKNDKKAEIADARWRAETGGMTFNGIEVATDRESQALLTGAVLAAQDNPEYVVNWKAKNGWFELDAATLIAIADAVRAHVQKCFDKEKQIQEQIDKATTVEELEAVVW